MMKRNSMKNSSWSFTQALGAKQMQFVLNFSMLFLKSASNKVTNQDSNLFLDSVTNTCQDGTRLSPSTTCSITPRSLTPSWTKILASRKFGSVVHLKWVRDL